MAVIRALAAAFYNAMLLMARNQKLAMYMANGAIFKLIISGDDECTAGEISILSFNVKYHRRQKY